MASAQLTHATNETEKAHTSSSANVCISYLIVCTVCEICTVSDYN